MRKPSASGVRRADTYRELQARQAPPDWVGSQRDEDRHAADLLLALIASLDEAGIPTKPYATHAPVLAHVTRDGRPWQLEVWRVPERERGVLRVAMFVKLSPGEELDSATARIEGPPRTGTMALTSPLADLVSASGDRRFLWHLLTPALRALLLRPALPWIAASLSPREVEIRWTLDSTWQLPTLRAELERWSALFPALEHPAKLDNDALFGLLMEDSSGLASEHLARLLNETPLSTEQRDTLLNVRLGAWCEARDYALLHSLLPDPTTTDTSLAYTASLLGILARADDTEAREHAARELLAASGGDTSELITHALQEGLTRGPASARIVNACFIATRPIGDTELEQWAETLLQLAEEDPALLSLLAEDEQVTGMNPRRHAALIQQGRGERKRLAAIVALALDPEAEETWSLILDLLPTQQRAADAALTTLYGACPAPLHHALNYLRSADDHAETLRQAPTLTEGQAGALLFVMTQRPRPETHRAYLNALIHHDLAAILPSLILLAAPQIAARRISRDELSALLCYLTRHTASDDPELARHVSRLAQHAPDTERSVILAHLSREGVPLTEEMFQSLTPRATGASPDPESPTGALFAQLADDVIQRPHPNRERRLLYISRNAPAPTRAIALQTIGEEGGLNTLRLMEELAAMPDLPASLRTSYEACAEQIRARLGPGVISGALSLFGGEEGGVVGGISLAPESRQHGDLSLARGGDHP